uniref:Uncharacterized protein n=1 Tax=Ditylenchus dipsaci TaxID=166011 RepID=A0A915D346_9BILA
MPSTSRIVKAQLPKTVIVDEVITVLDLVEDEDKNGTAETSKDHNLVRKTELSDSDEEMSEEKHKRVRKGSKTKKVKKHKDSKKHKESKKHKKRRARRGSIEVLALSRVVLR